METGSLSEHRATDYQWGEDGGRLGQGTSNCPPSCSSSIPLEVHGPGDVGFLSSIKAISAGSLHNLALASDGTVWAWGDNSSGELGQGPGGPTIIPFPVKVNGLTGVNAVAAGDGFSLALTLDGSVWVWGVNGYGQQGTGTSFTPKNSLPVRVAEIAGGKAIAAGFGHALVLTLDGRVWAWGTNDKGQLGTRPCVNTPEDYVNGTRCQIGTPLPVQGLGGVTAIAAGESFSLAVSGGQVFAWGSNSNGQLGDGTTTDSATPRRVGGIAGLEYVAAGRAHSLAAELIPHPPPPPSPVPVPSPPPPPVVTGLIPDHGPTTGGDRVVVSGSGFSGIRRVLFGDREVSAHPCPQSGGTGSAPCFTEDSPTRLSVFDPAHAPGKVHVRVASATAISRLTPADVFEYLEPLPPPPARDFAIRAAPSSQGLGPGITPVLPGGSPVFAHAPGPVTGPVASSLTAPGFAPSGVASAGSSQSAAVASSPNVAPAPGSVPMGVQQFAGVPGLAGFRDPNPDAAFQHSHNMVGQERSWPGAAGFEILVPGILFVCLAAPLSAVRRRHQARPAPRAAH